MGAKLLNQLYHRLIFMRRGRERSPFPTLPLSSSLHIPARRKIGRLQTMKKAWLFALLFVSACAPAAQPVGQPKTVGLQPIGRLADGKQSTVLGAAKLTNFSNARTLVEVQLSNQPPRSKHAGAIFKGTCNNRSSNPALLLNEMNADEAGNGTVRTEVETAKIPAPGYIVYYQRGRDEQNGIGDPITCGDLR